MMIWGPEIFGNFYNFLDQNLNFLIEYAGEEKNLAEFNLFLENEIMVPLDLMLERYRHYFSNDLDYNLA